MLTNKQLYSMLLGGALLASCSVDDGFDTNPVSSVNPNSPVFTVSFENGQELGQDTRAIFTPSSMTDVKLETKDCLSLYHGMSTTAANVTGYKNAVYRGGSDTDGKYTMSTQSMVEEGLAVLVYPVDSVNYFKTAEPLIFVDAEQTEDTKLTTPYVSAVLDIPEFEQGKEGTAGFGRKYDVAMRRVGGTLCLAFDLKDFTGFGDANVDPLEVTKVTLTNGSTTTFATKATIGIGGDKKVTEEDGKDVYPYGDNHKTWTHNTTITPSSDNASTSISTTDVVQSQTTPNRFTATFTLLPPLSSATANADFQIDLSTNYGTITINKSSAWKTYTDTDNKEKPDTKLWDDGTKADNVTVRKTIKDAFAGVLENIWKEREAEGKLTFEGEKAGGFVTGIINVPVDIHMDVIHVKNEKQLIQLATVIGILKPTDQVISLILDGSETSDTFVMTKDGQKAYATLLGYSFKDDNKKDVYPVQFSLCPGAASCTTSSKNKACELVKFVSYEANQAVPTLKFADKVRVQLAGEYQWTIGEGEYENVEFLSVAAGAKATLGATVSNKSATTTTTIENYGEVTVSQDVSMLLAMDNYSKITVNSGLFKMNAQTAILRNKAVITEAGYKKNTDGSVSGKFAADENGNTNYTIEDIEDPTYVVRGEIDIKTGAAIAAMDNSADGGKIYNYGTINVAQGGYAMVTKNETTQGIDGDNADITKPISPTNIFGVVNLNENNGMNKIPNGFVKGAAGNKCVNYITVNNANVTSVDLNKNMYIDVKNVKLGASLKAVKENNIIQPCKALIIRKEVPGMSVPDDIAISGVFYLKAAISRTGVIKLGDKATNDDTATEMKACFSSYFGGVQDDNKNHISSNNE